MKIFLRAVGKHLSKALLLIKALERFFVTCLPSDVGRLNTFNVNLPRIYVPLSVAAEAIEYYIKH